MISDLLEGDDIGGWLQVKAHEREEAGVQAISSRI